MIRNARQRRLVLPERHEERVHQRGVQQRRPVIVLRGDAAQQPPVEQPHPPLLLDGLGRGTELVHGGQRENVDVPIGQSRIPRARAATRHDGHAIGRDAEFPCCPANERDPVQQLEADLAGPGADDHRPPASRDAREAIEHPLFGPFELRVHAGRTGEPRECRPLTPHAGLQIRDAATRLLDVGGTQLPDALHVRARGGDLLAECANGRRLLLGERGQPLRAPALLLGIGRQQRLEQTARATKDPGQDRGHLPAARLHRGARLAIDLSAPDRLALVV